MQIIAAMSFYLGHPARPYPPRQGEPVDMTGARLVTIGETLDLPQDQAAVLIKQAVAMLPADWAKADKDGTTRGERITRNFAAAVALCQQAEAEAKAWKERKA